MDELAKHLRTVHFALIVTCVAVIVLVDRIPNTDINTAQQQVREIIQLKTNWTTWLQEWAQEQLGDYDPPGLRNEYWACDTVVGNIQVQLLWYPVAVRIWNSFGETDLSWRAEELGTYIALGHWRNGTFYSSAGNFQPTTLRDFAEFWGRSQSRDNPNIVVAAAPPSELTMRNGTDEYRYALSTEACGGGYLLYEFLADNPVNGSIPTGYGRWSLEVKIPQETRTITETLSSWLIRNESMTVSGGQGFEGSFPDLAEVASDFKNTRLEEAERVLNRLARSNADRVEILGLSLPVETLSWASIPLIVSLQMYLWMHLSAFIERSQNKSKSEIPRVAWIGLYRSFLSKRITLLTTAALPLVPTYLLWTTSKQEWRLWVPALVCLGLSLATGWLVKGRLWRITAGESN